MDGYLVGGLADFLHKRRALGVLRNGVGCGGGAGGLFVAHRRSLR